MTETTPPRRRGRARRLRAAWRSWRSGPGLLPTTRAGAELAVVITVVGWRIGTLAMMVPAVPTALERSTRPWLNILLLATVTVASAALLTCVIRRRRYISSVLSLADCAVALACLLAEPWYVPDTDLVGTWTGWAPAFAGSATMSVAAGALRRRHVLAMTVAIAAGYLAVSLPAVGHGVLLATVLSNTLTYFVFAFLCRTMATVARRFGADIDTARRTAVEATRRLEVERQRRRLHDQASLLHHLADPHLDPELAAAVRAQALAEANRIRAFLTDPGEISTGAISTGAIDGGAIDGGLNAADGRARSAGPATLADIVRATAVDFTDLHVELLLDLAGGARLHTDAAQALGAAIATVLHNVRRHAGPGARVVVHADYEPGEREWEITVRDDGRGFDPRTTPAGYGLREVAGTALAEHAITSHVHSAPGLGTTITIRGTAHP